MKPGKTNTEFLREVISKTLASNSENYDEVNEFIDAIEDDITDFKDEIKSLQLEVNEKETIISNMEDEIRDGDFEEIDCGIGIIEYRTDNLKLQLLMEDFKEKQERVIYQ